MFNPLMPKYFGALRVRTRGGTRVEQARRTDTYVHQLDAFATAVLDGAPFPTSVDDAVDNMVVIDDLYRAAGMQPRRATAEVVV
jgi:hypothetical protein